MKRIHVIILACVTMIALSCCPCRKGVSRDHKPFAGTKWTLVQLNGAGFAADNNFFITFDATQSTLTGKGDCNTIAGKYTMMSDGNRLTFGETISTKMFCKQQDKEDQFLLTLGEVDSYDIDGDLLLLLSGSEVVAVMKAE